MGHRIAGTALAGVMLLTSGCFWTRATERDPDRSRHYGTDYDYTDLMQATDLMIRSLANEAPRAPDGTAPVVVPLGIANNTDEHIDTQAIVDRIRVGTIREGRVRYVANQLREDIQREVLYQRESGRVRQDTWTEIGRQTGARYALTGRLMSIRGEQGRGLRASRRDRVYYQLTVELVDLGTTEVVWAQEARIAREKSEPLIGW